MKNRIAIVGIGRWGKKLLNEFNKLADVAYCVHGGNTDTTAWLADNYPTIPTSSYENVLLDTTVNAVVIATPIKTHFELAFKALSAGKHVFLEKPGCESATQLNELISLAKNKKVGFQIGYIFLHHPCFTYLKEHVGRPIKSITCSWDKFGSFEENIIMNLACHEFSLLHGLQGVAPSSETIVNMSAGISPGDIVNICADYAHESRATITINRISAQKRKSMTIVTQDGIWFWENECVWRSVKGGPYELVFENSSSPLTKECSEFISIVTGTPNMLHTDIALSVHKSLAAL